ncbi:hypothetical protein ACFE04_011321 [Oxalis oulophora]
MDPECDPDEGRQGISSSWLMKDEGIVKSMSRYGDLQPVYCTGRLRLLHLQQYATYRYFYQFRHPPNSVSSSLEREHKHAYTKPRKGCQSLFQFHISRLGFDRNLDQEEEEVRLSAQARVRVTDPGNSGLTSNKYVIDIFGQTHPPGRKASPKVTRSSIAAQARHTRSYNNANRLPHGASSYEVSNISEEQRDRQSVELADITFLASF